MKMHYLRSAEMQPLTENKTAEEVKNYASELNLKYGKITFVIQDGKVLDVIIENRKRI